MHAGNRPWPYQTRAGSLITTAAAGSGPIAVGIGYQTIRGAGPHSIMAVGFTTTGWVGAGLRIMYGGLPGLAGDTLTITAVGRPCRPVQFLLQAWGLLTMAMR